jgi:hypothetical protein
MLTTIIIAMLGGSCEPLPPEQDLSEECYDRYQNKAQCQELGDDFLAIALPRCEAFEELAEESCCELEAYAFVECVALLSCSELLDYEDPDDWDPCEEERDAWVECVTGGVA